MILSVLLRTTDKSLFTKHLDRYVKEFVGRHNTRSMDTLDQMADMVFGMNGKRLDYATLIS